VAGDVGGEDGVSAQFAQNCTLSIVGVVPIWAPPALHHLLLAAPGDSFKIVPPKSHFQRRPARSLLRYAAEQLPASSAAIMSRITNFWILPLMVIG